MRKGYKLIAMLAALLVCLSPMARDVLVVHAQEPTTYYLKYVESEGEWRFQTGSAWQDNGYHRELYYMQQDIKDGDLLVVDSAGNSLTLDVGVRLSNLTVLNGTAVITTKGIDNCYVTNDAVCVANGDVTNAYLYRNALANFNNNVNYLEVNDDQDIQSEVVVAGTVADFHQVCLYKGLDLHLYNFQANTMHYAKGSLKTEEKYYSATPAEGTATGPAPAPSTPAPEQAPAPAPSAPASDEYDDVPKTGVPMTEAWLLAASLACCLGGYRLRKGK